VNFDVIVEVVVAVYISYLHLLDARFEEGINVLFVMYCQLFLSFNAVQN
jgi:hypothetical protein